MIQKILAILNRPEAISRLVNLIVETSTDQQIVELYNKLTNKNKEWFTAELYTEVRRVLTSKLHTLDPDKLVAIYNSLVVGEKSFGVRLCFGEEMVLSRSYLSDGYVVLGKGDL